VIGAAKVYIGRAEETEAHIQEAFRFSPKDTNACMWTSVAGYSKLFLGKDREAVTLLRQAVEINRNYPTAHFWLAAALAIVGHIDEDAPGNGSRTHA
jgi:tetratricopeptide (TPR) repeat protein